MRPRAAHNVLRTANVKDRKLSCFSHSEGHSQTQVADGFLRGPKNIKFGKPMALDNEHLLCLELLFEVSRTIYSQLHE